MQLQASLQHLVYALSDMLDLVGIDDAYHGKRVAWMALTVARQLGWDAQECSDLFYASLLHDCGVSSTAVHQHLVGEMDWVGSQHHCERGAELLASIPLLAHLAPVIRYHHTHWSQLESLNISTRVRCASNLIFLVDRVDAMIVAHAGSDVLLDKITIQQQISGFAGRLFDSTLVEGFLASSHADAFWLMLEPRHLQSFLGKELENGRNGLLDFAELRQMAGLFSTVVDAKSPFTASHSEGVAALSRKLGELAGFDQENADKLELAGLFHDLGKLRIPDAILEKPGKLTPEERQFMRRHSFETYQILSRVPGMEEIATWAAFHHETLDGGGYPYELAGCSLPLPARIVAVADVFQALAQQRPYRQPWTPSLILADLQRRVEEGQLDRQVVNLVADNLEICWQYARPAAAIAVD